MADNDDVEALAAEYVLGTLDPAERLTVEARLAADPALRAAVGAWAARLQPLADSAPVSPAPPQHVFDGISARIDAPVDLVSSAVNLVALRSTVRRWRALTGLATAAALVLAVFVAVDRGRPPETEYVAMLTPDGGAPSFVITVDTRANTMSIRRVAGTGPETGRSYELWAVEPEQAPQSLGVVDTVSLTRPLPYAPDGLVFAISDEPEGGSPTGTATGGIIFSGPLVPAD